MMTVRDQVFTEHRNRKDESRGEAEPNTLAKNSKVPESRQPHAEPPDHTVDCRDPDPCADAYQDPWRSVAHGRETNDTVDDQADGEHCYQHHLRAHDPAQGSVSGLCLCDRFLAVPTGHVCTVVR